MIEVNLIPGGKKRSAKKGGRGKGMSLSLSGGGGSSRDPWVLGAIVAWVGVVGAMGWFYFSLTRQVEEVEVAIATQVQDSARFAEIIEQVQGLIARRDSIIQRVDIIQSIDQDRYVWPHVLDEVARALPDYTWLTGMVQTVPPPDLQVQLTGQAGNNFAVAEFITRLSDSPFIRVADFVSSSQVVQDQGDAGQQIVYDFTLEVYFQPPPPEILETVPLFDEGELTPPSPGA
ncbi:MAG: PilN domain-containing protein [Gemmatimonadales bacterium]|nr:MAG: PilN domain-containing protein [Gemmatimonadales bacterium]